MKGLLLKDWYQIKAYGKLIILSVLVMMGCSVFTLQHNNSVFLVWGCCILGNLTMTLIAYDSNCGWNVYANTLPLSRVQVVGEKYLFSFLMMLLGAGMSGIVCLAAWCMGAPIGAGSAASVMLQGAEVIWVLSIIMLPVYYRFGSEKARYVYLLIIGMIGGIVGVVLGGNEGSLDGLFMAMSVPVQAIVLVGIAALSVLSWRLSLAWYGVAERNR